MFVRRYNPGEEQELWRLYYNTTHFVNGKYYTKDQVERWAPHDKDMDEWKKRIETKNPFVVVEDGVILGFGELEPNGHIDYFYVHYQWQGKGVGSALYEAIEKEAIKEKMSYLHAEVSLAAKEFFLKKGFKILEEKNNIVCGAPAPNFMMKKELGNN